MDHNEAPMPASDPSQRDRIAPLVERGIEFVANTGLRLDDASRGYVRMTMPLQGNINHIGTMYAGALFTLAEVPGGALFMATFDPEKYYPIVAQLDLRFRRPATTDITVEVTMDEAEIDRISAEADRDGKAPYQWTSQLRDTSGEVVAISTNQYQMRTHGM